jgi:DNA helicase-2/ATP-dependent DNA helicase PcrA
MINQTEQEERVYLEEIKERLLLTIQRVDKNVKQFTEELRLNKQYIYEHQSGMDEADMVAAGQSINRMAFTGESAEARKRKLMKLGGSPYFGRIDFVTNAEGEPAPIYIGIYTFTDETQRANLIYDWRAPISSMFYDFELGEAGYETPSGKINGEITLKRQYKIRDGKMEFMIENSVNIHDDILQKELSKSADDKMKNIVATIQRDQNAVIRNETAQVMIIQGVAGSGKTSIALHRIAFLLYRYRDTIKSKDILILSPNKVFADYISNVLPELGEENIPEMGMEELAVDLLENKYSFQTFFQQVSALLENPHPAFIERMQFKSSYDFLTKLNRYFIHLENNSFQHTELKVAGVIVPFPFIVEKFKAWHRMPMLKRTPEVVKEILQFVRNSVNRKLSGGEKAKVWEAIPRMLNVRNVFDVYKDFYAWVGRPELFRMMPNGQFEYADVFPLIYCKIRLEGVHTYDHVKHLLVDEMQDYTPIQYAVLSRVFKCKKTILGDVNQTVNPYSASSAEGIEQIFPMGDVVKLWRTYRSTWEITHFAQGIVPNPNLIAMERHGEKPMTLSYNNSADEMEGVKTLVARFSRSGHQSLGIICKTRQQADLLYQKLKAPDIHLLTADSTSFSNGIVITTIHLAKGLEFDEVIVPFSSASHYQTEVDKRLLYIACTRAMHRLTLTYSGERTAFIKDQP